MRNFSFKLYGGPAPRFFSSGDRKFSGALQPPLANVLVRADNNVQAEPRRRFVRGLRTSLRIEDAWKAMHRLRLLQQLKGQCIGSSRMWAIRTQLLSVSTGLGTFFRDEKTTLGLGILSDRTPPFADPTPTRILRK